MPISTLLTILNLAIAGLFFLCYFNQVLYVLIVWFKKMPPHKTEDAPVHRLAVLIAARNEEGVIGALIDSLREQDYPADRFDIFVCADNCTDGTARVAAVHGATVYERESKDERGKGYALDFLLRAIDRDLGEETYDAYVVFDADNTASKSYLTEINKTFSDGYEVVASYRNAKNYGDTPISAGNGMWFLRDSHYLNGARMRIGASCFISGTGFLFSRRVKEQNGGWPFHLLTEDAEFTAHCALNGVRIGYCERAEFFDEQPTSHKVSRNQRIRWVKGGVQVFRRYGKALFRGIFSRRFLTCYDLSMGMTPAYLISLFAVAANTVCLAISLLTRTAIPETLAVIGALLGACYFFVFLFGLVTTLSEWRRIHTSAFKKILYTFTFPLFMLSYIPVCIRAAFQKAEWVSTPHKSREGDTQDLTSK